MLAQSAHWQELPALAQLISIAADAPGASTTWFSGLFQKGIGLPSRPQKGQDPTFMECPSTANDGLGGPFN